MKPLDPSWLQSLKDDHRNGVRRLAVLLDPEDTPSGSQWVQLMHELQASDATDIFVGGSLVTDGATSRVVHEAKRALSQPVVLFPGAPVQICEDADALLFLSLISGRNPDLLIGRHVEAAPRLAHMNLETVPTGYMLIGDPPLTAAAYMSHSLPIPSAKPELAVATAQAGALLGLQCLYMDAERRRPAHLSFHDSSRARRGGRPSIVGGGLTSQEDPDRAWDAGATCVVVGSAVEREPAVLQSLRARR